MPQQTLSQIVHSLLSEVNKYKLVQISHGRMVPIKEAKTIFDTPRLEQHLAENCVFNSWLEMQAIITAQRAGVVADLYLFHGRVKPEKLKTALVKRLYNDYGLRRDIARWAVEQWAAALGSFLNGTTENTDLAPLQQAARELSYTTVLVSDKDLLSSIAYMQEPLKMPPAYLSPEPVSNALWRSVFPNYVVQSGWDNFPVSAKYRNDTLQFCNLLSIRDGLMPPYNFNRPKQIYDETANGWRLLSRAEYRFISLMWGRSDSYLRIARNA